MSLKTPILVTWWALVTMMRASVYTRITLCFPAYFKEILIIGGSKQVQCFLFISATKFTNTKRAGTGLDRQRCHYLILYQLFYKIDIPCSMEKQGRTHKWCTPMDPRIWPSKSRTTSSNIHTAAMWGYGM